VPIAEGNVPTNRASRYLVQICDHLAELRHHSADRHGRHIDGGAPQPPQVLRVEHNDVQGVITFSFGQCTLDASDTSLAVLLAAEDDDSLRRLQTMLANRIAIIGRRDNLRLTW
jgi:hypothetical protein